MRNPLLTTVAVIVCLLAWTVSAPAKTLILEGKLDGTVAMRQSMEFAVNRGNVSAFSFKFALPATFATRTVSQSINGLDLSFTPRPASSTVETDRFGNRFQKVTWNDVTQDIRVNLSYGVTVHTELTALESKTPFPLGSRANPEAQYLKATELVQSGSGDIAAHARTLTAQARTQYEAVTAVTNWVADNIKYTFNPPQYDAAYTLATRSGNCQNFAHLAIALLRSVGIPARIVGGITLKDPWKVPIDAKNSIVQSMGQGGHAWLEVWFPDLGWLPYDPQQSKQFTSSRHIKQSHGLDSKDINDTWRGAPYLPAYSELIEGRFTSDAINLKMKRFDTAPRPYVLSNLVAAVAAGSAPVAGETPPQAAVASRRPEPQPEPKAKAQPEPRPSKPAEPPQGSGAGPAETRFVTDEGPLDDEGLPKPTGKKPAKPVKPTKPLPKPEKSLPESKPAPEPGHKKPRPGTSLVFGNMEFPNLVNLYNVKGDTGTRVFERETSEYVTSKYIFAQAVQVKAQMSLDRISLAMRKFGGDGSVYIDLVKDKGGRPDIMQGIRSNLIDLEKIARKPGYYWVDFSFPPDGARPHQLVPGKYWIVLRASGEAIMNWFYIPGKPYSEGDDTRSTAKGFQWEDILNYDFVFKVSGKAL
ncbi:transglutaminase domain-containing protein [Trichlorobacter ammonificans]|uniref:Transglutaminase domain protein n=1 Tax=Trichlorobacter ammonificans TaxID=2916410 RepID=A0ABM9DAR8_9BACT|nr:transglutaminase domain-containing protein [Trichlorobacter ammonificans]CAH2031472.1 Transglutaminase domain protein [Trichlorobacter ammonificans]